jgi:hypothetical protein
VLSFYAEGVVLHSPGSRSAPRDCEKRNLPFQTLKGFYKPGSSFAAPALCNPFRVVVFSTALRTQGALRDLGLWNETLSGFWGRINS